MMDIELIKQYLEKHLKKERYLHSLNTALTARQLAQYQRVDADNAYLAGLVHDCAKNLSDAELLDAAKRFGIPTDPIILHSPQLLHGAVGAHISGPRFAIPVQI